MEKVKSFQESVCASFQTTTNETR